MTVVEKLYVIQGRSALGSWFDVLYEDKSVQRAKELLAEFRAYAKNMAWPREYRLIDRVVTTEEITIDEPVSST